MPLKLQLQRVGDELVMTQKPKVRSEGPWANIWQKLPQPFLLFWVALGSPDQKSAAESGPCGT